MRKMESSPLFAHVCVLYMLYVCGGAPVCLSTCDDPRMMLESSSFVLPCYSLRQGVLLKPRAYSYGMASWQLALGILCLCLPSLELIRGWPSYTHPMVTLVLRKQTLACTHA